MAEPLRVAFASHTANTGSGAENVLVGLVSELDKSRIRPVVLVPEEGGPMEEALARAGVETLRAPMRWWIGSPGQLERFPEGREERVRAMRRVLEALAPGLVVTNTCVVREAADAARELAIPHVWYCHEMLSGDPWFHTPDGAGAACAEIASLSRVVACVSGACRDGFLTAAPQIGPARVEVLHTGLSGLEPGGRERARRRLLELTGFAPGAVVACFAGAVSERKGAPLLAECVARLAGSVPELRFAVIGPDAGAAEGMLARLETTPARQALAWLGARPDAVELMRGADMLVLPSVFDSFPLVVQEAMHLGLPVAATASGGACELVEHGVSGFLTPVGDAEALTASMARLARDEALRRSMGRAGRERALTLFSRQSYLDKAASLFERAAQQPEGRGR